MSLSPGTRASRLAAVGAVLVATGGLALATGTSAANAADSCTPADRADTISSLTIETSRPRQHRNYSFDFAGTLPDGGCAGDWITLTAPPSVHLTAGTAPLLDTEGTEIGSMVIADNVVTVTFNEFAETHRSITFGGHIHGWLDPSLPPDSHQELVFGNPDGNAPISINVQMASCTTCAVPTTPVKSAFPSGDRVYARFTSLPTRAAGEVVTVTDVVGAGQAVDCDELSGYATSTRDAWGSLIDQVEVPVTVVQCDAAGFTATMTATAAGQYLELHAEADQTDTTLTSYADAGTVTQDGRSFPVAATARRQGALAFNAFADGEQIEGDNEEPAPPTPTATDEPAVPEVPVPTPTDFPDVPAPTATDVPDVPIPTTDVPDVPIPTTDVPDVPDIPVPTATLPVVDPLPPTDDPTNRPVDDPTTGGPTDDPTDTTDAEVHRRKDRLPDTGLSSASAGLAAGGILLLGAGAGLVLLSRRRPNLG